LEFHPIQWNQGCGWYRIGKHGNGDTQNDGSPYPWVFDNPVEKKRSLSFGHVENVEQLDNDQGTEGQIVGLMWQKTRFTVVGTPCV
jgi:hypothetical protein